MFDGAALREIRKARGLTQARAAKITGMTQGHWAALESGIRAPSLAMVENIAQVLLCSVVDLLSEQK